MRTLTSAVILVLSTAAVGAPGPWSDAPATSLVAGERVPAPAARVRLAADADTGAPADDGVAPDLDGNALDYDLTPEDANPSPTDEDLDGDLLGEDPDPAGLGDDVLTDDDAAE
jgi:hypothetical protein